MATADSGRWMSRRPWSPTVGPRSSADFRLARKSSYPASSWWIPKRTSKRAPYECRRPRLRRPLPGRSHDRQADPLVDRESLPGLAGHGDGGRLGRVVVDPDTGGCPAGPVRRAGHHPHNLSRPGTTDRREPDYLSTDDDHAVGAGREDGARLLLFWRLVRLCAVRRRHRPVLGPLSGTGVSESGAVAAAGRGQSLAGRHGQAVPGRTRPRPAARLQPAARQGGGGDPEGQPGERWLCAGARRGRVYGADLGLSENPG